jgi:hypothetical protein
VSTPAAASDSAVYSLTSAESPAADTPREVRKAKAEPARQRKKKLQAAADEGLADIEADLHGQSSVVAGVDEAGWHAPRQGRTTQQPAPLDQIERHPARNNLRRFLPLLLAFAGLAGGMVFWLTSNRARERAEVQLKQALEESEQKFFDGQYADAYRILQTADEAIRILAVTDNRADQVRNMLRQADALSHLLDASVMHVVEAGEKVIQKSGLAAWNGDFAVNYEGRWIVMQIQVPATVQSDSEIRYEWMVDEHSIVLDGLGTIAGWVRKKSQLNEMIFAARLQGCRRDSQAGNIWVVEFDPKSAFLWTDETSLIRQNMIPVFDESAAARMRKIVRQQLEMGEAPPPPPEAASRVSEEGSEDRETADES